MDGRGKGGGRGDVSSTTVVTFISMGVVAATSKGGLLPSKGGTVADWEQFSISVSGDLTLCMDRSIIRDGGGGMNKGGCYGRVTLMCDLHEFRWRVL
jgi:hypothetical protein